MQVGQLLDYIYNNRISRLAGIEIGVAQFDEDGSYDRLKTANKLVLIHNKTDLFIYDANEEDESEKNS